jgi:hypothetical protein
MSSADPNIKDSEATGTVSESRPRITEALTIRLVEALIAAVEALCAERLRAAIDAVHVERLRARLDLRTTPSTETRFH